MDASRMDDPLYGIPNLNRTNTQLPVSSASSGAGTGDKRDVAL